MADLSITAASVVTSGSDFSKEVGVAGETITAGMAVYKSSSTGKWMKADNNAASAEARTALGIALTGSSLNQPIVVQTDGDVTIGASLTAGAEYYLSDTAGGICPVADVGSGEYICRIGIAKSTTVLAIDINYPGVQV